jgi:hypothetical protein
MEDVLKGRVIIQRMVIERGSEFREVEGVKKPPPAGSQDGSVPLPSEIENPIPLHRLQEWPQSGPQIGDLSDAYIEVNVTANPFASGTGVGGDAWEYGAWSGRGLSQQASLLRALTIRRELVKAGARAENVRVSTTTLKQTSAIGIMSPQELVTIFVGRKAQ